MRIFCAIHSNPSGAALPSSRIWKINLVDSLERMGFDLVFPSFDMDEHRRRCRGPAEEAKAARTQYSELLLNDVKEAHESRGLDLFLSYYYSQDILGEVIDEIGALGIPTTNFFCDSIDRFDQVAEISPHFHYCIVPEKPALAKYESVGARPVHIQMAANPAMYKPFDLAVEYDVTFVGKNRFNRSQYVSYLLKNGVDMRVWGAAWGSSRKDYPLIPSSMISVLREIKCFMERSLCQSRTGFTRYSISQEVCGPPLSDQQLIEMYSRCRISLGFSELWDAQSRSYLRNVRLRDFEAPMSGAFYITGYQEELWDYYELGSEIVCYHDERDLLDKVRYYLRHEAEAHKIRQAGYRRALAEHTWQKRFEKLFGIIGLNRRSGSAAPGVGGSVDLPSENRV